MDDKHKRYRLLDNAYSNYSGPVPLLYYVSERQYLKYKQIYFCQEVLKQQVQVNLSHANFALEEYLDHRRNEKYHIYIEPMEILIDVLQI